MNLYGEKNKQTLNAHGFETMQELHNYIGNFLVNDPTHIYEIDNRLYRLPAIDVSRGIVRLIEVSTAGDYLYNTEGKTIKRRMKFQDFEELAVIRE